MIDLTTGTMLALTIAGLVTPWIVEIIKRAFKNPEGKAALSLSIGVSFLIAIGVLLSSGDFAFNNPLEMITATGLVLGIASSVYTYIKKAVKAPIDIIEKGIRTRLEFG